ncbi:restriction endonuclease subunit S [Lactobacillus delbrueckii subsp. bulgaricus]|nr:hypothetical protein [Lactobacillus delbrueckii subsp. bulgaricus]
MKDEKKAPKLRFKGFIDDWEQCKLGDVAKINSGKDYKGLQPGKIPVYGTGGYMLSVNDKLSDIDAIGIGRKGTIDKPYYLNAPFWTVDTLFYVTPRGTVDISFMFPLFKNINWKRYDESTGVPSLSKNTIKKIRVSFPQNNEQVKIGDLFQKITQIITLHEEKKHQLERLKSALLQKMFADKSGYPDIRFEGFSDEWEQCKLGDVCEPITDSIDTQKYPNEVFAEYSMPAFDASMKPYIVLGSSMNSVRKIITRPCLLVNKLNVRKKRIWYVKKPNKNAVCSAEFIPLRSDTVDLTFLNQVAKSETFTRYLENHSSGSSNSQKRITPRSLMLSKLHIPTIEEQKLIGKIFEYLDHTITLHDQKLNLLKLVKQSLLQNMFI